MSLDRKVVPWGMAALMHRRPSSDDYRLWPLNSKLMISSLYEVVLPGQMSTWGFYTTIRGSVIREFSTMADPRGVRRYLYAIVVSKHVKRCRPKFSGTRCIEECLGTNRGSMHGSVALADMMMVVTRSKTQNIPY